MVKEDAAQKIEHELKPIFGDKLSMTVERGIGVTFARESENDYYKRKMDYSVDAGPWVNVTLIIVPAGPDKVDVKLSNRQDIDTLKSIGVTFRRPPTSTMEKAAEYVIKWFKSNADKLKSGQAKMASMILRVASRYMEADTHDTQLAINQILMRNGWSPGPNGKLIKKVKAPFQMSPKIYVLETLRDGDLAVRDNGGRVLSKVDITDDMSNAQILDAAKRLNNGAQSVAYR